MKTNMLHLPINSPRRERCGRLTFVAVYAASGVIMFAVAAMIYHMIFHP